MFLKLYVSFLYPYVDEGLPSCPWPAGEAASWPSASAHSRSLSWWWSSSPCRAEGPSVSWAACFASSPWRNSSAGGWCVACQTAPPRPPAGSDSDPRHSPWWRRPPPRSPGRCAPLAAAATPSGTATDKGRRSGRLLSSREHLRRGVMW